ncbi:fasciclin domain-containing protein [Salisaeta longa]|uniref:fasciclin domain-containing protein n=1 Tax=Salisaeta longa TaxID=503170 RepID=UPI0003B491D9|nr:fasciclin domain-containing protein [Salisaeta longa]
MYRTLIASGLLALLLVIPAQAQSDTGDIVETAIEAKGFNTLVKAVQAADLVETLKGEGPFTVFAPTDKAFAALPDGTLESLLKPENKDQLRAILTYHVVSGEVTAEEVVGMDQAMTVQGQPLGIMVQDGTVYLQGKNKAQVVTTDIQTSNGVIHVIDTVLLPPAEEDSGDMGGDSDGR